MMPNVDIALRLVALAGFVCLLPATVELAIFAVAGLVGLCKGKGETATVDEPD